MSRTQLHRKLTALTNHSPSISFAICDFIAQWACLRVMPARSQRSPTVSDLAILHTSPECFTRFLESPRARSAKAPGKYPRGAKHPPRACPSSPDGGVNPPIVLQRPTFLRIEYRVGGEAQVLRAFPGMRHMYLHCDAWPWYPRPLVC